MRTASFVLMFIGSTALLADDKPVKWEYAELTYRIIPARPAGKDMDGKEVPAVAASLTINWITGPNELTASGWPDLAEQLKATIKKDAGAESQKIQVMNSLGENGWELVDVQMPVPSAPAARGGGFGPGGPQQLGGGGPLGRAGATIMLFKRRR